MRALLVAMVVALAACGTSLPDDATGEEVYTAVCARCHGADLAGGVGPALGAGTEVSEQPDDYYVQTISRGRGRMPAFGSSLTEHQIDRVIEYLRARQAAPD